MGSLRKFKVNGKNREFESHLVNVSKIRATNVSKNLKEKFGNKIHVRVVKAPKKYGSGYDVFTDPDEREFHRLRRKK